MPNQPVIAPNRTAPITVLSVSPLEGDHTALEAIIRHSNWALFKADSPSVAGSILHRQDVSVVLCERDLKPGTWTDLLDHIKDWQRSPSLIVTSRVADERLWAEAINLGAWDVLAKPFDRTEVLRSVKSAWQHWHDHNQIPTSGMKVMRVAS